MSATAGKISDLSPGERWVAFLRGYGPINRVEGMFAETVRKHARRYDIVPIMFEHPELETLRKALDPAAGRLTNVVLTGTAGDGKTTLCDQLWDRFGGAKSHSAGSDRKSYRSLVVDTPQGRRTIHFLFEFTGWSADKGQAWAPERLDLLGRFARSVRAEKPDEYFVIAANDGRLVQTWDSLPSGSEAATIAGELEELLASDENSLAERSLLFLNLSRMSTRLLLEKALEAILARPEWACLENEAVDPAFGPDSPLTRNYRLLQDPAIRERLLSLAGLLDANGLHVPIREVVLLIVNGLLGWSEAPEHVADVGSLRRMVEAGRGHEAALYGNLFGANLPERRRDGSAVFRHLEAFRIGHETTNTLDNLLIHGQQDPALKPDHGAILAADPHYGVNPSYEAARQAYLEADDEREDGSIEFLEALISERRRLFFRLPETGGRLDPWKLSVFQSAEMYRRSVLGPLVSGRGVDPSTVRLLVRGLNRIWTGMLVGELDRLYLSTGLDLSTSRISDIYLYDIPLRRSPHGEEVSVFMKEGDLVPTLRVSLDSTGRGAQFKLHLTRFEFLIRVAGGSLPSSFSKECNEDVLSFKTQILAEYYRLVGDVSSGLTRLVLGPKGGLTTKQLGVRFDFPG